MRIHTFFQRITHSSIQERALRIACIPIFITALVSAQTPPAKQFVYTSGTSSLPASLINTPNLVFNSVNGLFDFENLSSPTEPTVFIKKAPGEHGLFILDNNPGDSKELYNALNIELYNMTSLDPSGDRAGIRVHVDPSNTAPPNSGFAFSNLNGIEVGNHGQYTTGLIVETQGAATSPSTYQTNGVGITSISWGLGSFLGTESDAAHSTLGTVGAQFNHYSTGHILSLNQASSTMSGDFIYGNAAYDGTGSLSGNFLNFNANGLPKFRVDASGNLTIPALKATTGTRFVCVDTNGLIKSQATPCSGT